MKIGDLVRHSNRKTPTSFYYNSVGVVVGEIMFPREKEIDRTFRVLWGNGDKLWHKLAVLERIANADR